MEVAVALGHHEAMRTTLLLVWLGACGDEPSAIDAGTSIDSGARADAGALADAGRAIDAAPRDASIDPSSNVLLRLDFERLEDYMSVLHVYDGVLNPERHDSGARFEHQRAGAWDASGAARFWPPSVGLEGHSGVELTVGEHQRRIAVGWTVSFGPRFADALEPLLGGTCKPLILIPAEGSLSGPWSEPPEWINPRVILHYRRGDVGGRTVVYAYADNNTERSSMNEPFFILDDHLEEWLWFHVLADKDALTIELTIRDRTGATLASESIPMLREDGLFEHVSMSFFGAMEGPDDDAHYTLGEVIVADGPIAPPPGFVQ